MNTLIVNYDIPLKDVIAKGNYDWFNNDITQENFKKPTQTGQATLEWELFNFPEEVVFSADATSRIEEKGFRAATHFELATFGAQYPEEQRGKWIAALGSSCLDSNGYVRVAYLNGDSWCRFLRLVSWVGDWFSGFWFLGVRQVSDTVEIEPSALSPSESLPLEVMINGVVYVPKR